MSFLDVLKECRDLGIRLAAKNGKLMVGDGGGRLSAELRARITACKGDILAWLDDATAPAPPSIAPQPGRTEFPLSFPQQRLWFIDRLDGDSTQYNVPIAFGLKGALDEAACARALDTIIERHAVLRTVFTVKDGEPVQVVRPPLPLAIAYIDLAALGGEAQAARVRELMTAEAEKPFDLAHDTMLRFTLLRRGPDSHVVLFTLHHIASDGWSMGVLVGEFVALYEAYTAGRANPLPPLAVQYADYAAWQRDAMNGGLIETQLGYWKEKLASLPAIHALPLDKARPARQRYEAQRHNGFVGASLADALRALGRTHGASLFMVLQGAFAAVLARFSGEADIVMGVPNAGRAQKEVAPLIGFFINTLIFRTAIDDTLRVDELVAQSRLTAVDAFANAHVPFDLLNDVLKPERSLAYNPLCQIKFVLQNHDSGELKLPGLTFEPVGQGSERVRFDLDLTASESDAGLHLYWTYKDDLFDRATIERFAQAYERLLAQMVARPEARLADLRWTDDDTTAALRELGRGPDSHAFRDASLPRQIAAQALRTPDAVAVRAGEDALTYAEFDRRANRLAHALMEQGVGRGERVGIHLDRSIELMIALVAVMKTGAAYVMLDARQTPERLKAIVADAGIAIALVDSRRSVLLVKGLDTVFVDGAASDADWMPDYPESDPAVAIDGDDSAYVLYTSGSTGTPKGVEIRHAGLTDYCAFAREGYYADHVRGSLVATSAAFDLTVPSLYVPLLTGGCVDLMPAEDELIELARRLDGDAPASLLRLTPSHVRGVLSLADDAPRDAAHVFVIGGEAFAVVLAKQLQAKFPQAHIYNHYGPTETVVGCTWYDASANLATLDRTIPIGRPMSNTQLYVLGTSGQVQPVGVAGELYIGGAGVAKGYVNRPELTAEKFVADPFVPGARVYRSGDRARWRADGTLEFLGRVDDQVKLRGFRIELGDIESVLKRCAGVRDAVAAVRGDADDARLVAYVVGDMNIERVKAHASEHLPAYMLPAAIVALDALPLTPNGKVDRRALPALDAAPPAVLVAATTATELQLAAIWQDVLRRERVGVHDNFFEIGGDSILSIQVVARANRAGIAITTRQLFEAQTIAQLARHADSAAPIDMPQGPVEGPLTLLPIQRQFLVDDARDRHHYNQAVLLDVPAALTRDALVAIVGALYRRHDALRARIAERDTGWHAGHAPLDAALIDAACVVEALPNDAAQLRAFVTARCEYWQAAFDLAHGPLLRAVLMRGETTARLLIVAHHAVIDGVSWRIVLADLEQAYAQVERGEPVALAPKTSSFQQWGEALAALAHDGSLHDERRWWIAQAARLVAPLPADFDGNADADIVATSEQVSLRLSADDTRLLLAHCNHAYRTRIDELLLAGAWLGLRRWTGEAGLRIALEGHGREAPFAHLDVTQTVGWFTAIHPLTLWSDSAHVADVIRATKEACRAVPARGIGYGLLRHIAEDADLIAAEAGVRPSLAFNYLGQLDRTLAEEGRFRVAREATGTAASPRRRRRHALVLNGMVVGGELSFVLEYGATRHARATMERVAGYIEDGLRAVIDHCAQRERAGWTPSDFPHATATQAQLDAWQAQYPAMSRLYRATPMQAGLYFHTQIERSAYTTQAYPVLHGALDAAHFRAAWQAVVNRHDIFRTAFVGNGDALQQLVSGTAELPWHEEDWRDVDADTQAQRFEAFRARDHAQGFDFDRAPLMRVALFRIADDRHRLLWTYHHMLSDGWSTPLIYREVMEVYAALVAGHALALPPAPVYENYVAWLARRDEGAAVAYWRSHLQSVSAPTPLVVDRATGAQQGYREQSYHLDRVHADALQSLAQSRRVTVGLLVQLAWACVLQRYSGDRDVVFGTTVSGRPPEVPGIEEMVGLFINTIPVKASFGDGRALADVLADLQADYQRATEHAHLSLAQIQRQSQVPSGLSLFDSLLVVGNYPIGAATELEARGDGDASRLRVEAAERTAQTGYQLSFNVALRGGVHMVCGYPGEAFDDATIARLLEHFGTVLRQLPGALDGNVRALDLLPDAERRLIESWSRPAAAAIPAVCAHTLFEEWARRTPDAIAAVFDGEAITYAELDQRANRIARYLIAQDVAPDTLVGLCVERSLDMIAGVLGILKAGAAYLPLDPTYPEERLADMLDDAGVSLVLTQEAVLEALPVLGDRTVLLLDGPLGELMLSSADGTPLDAARATPGGLAYAIYTSGSTGKPKGVLLEHRGMVNLAMNQRALFALSPASRVLAFASMSFDGAAWEWLMALANGASLHIAHDDDRRSAERLATLLATHGITHAAIPPALLAQLDPARGYALDVLIVAGEACDEKLAWTWAQRCRVCNSYGPSEGTVAATHADIAPGRTITLGRALANVEVQVLDGNGKIQPIGVDGELYIGGAGLARGYLARPELTAQRFVAHPSRTGERLYRTGDRAVWRDDGELVFLGRADDQVKVRGFRIELGEIEAALLAEPSVESAVALVAGDDGAKRLVAYVVAMPGDDGERPDPGAYAASLRGRLGHRLPEYMVPSAIVVLDALPLNANGKIDRRALPAPDLTAAVEYIAPATATERALAAAWAEVLGLDAEAISANANFFDLGGHSILAIRLASQLADTLPRAITVKDMFQHPTLQALAAHVDAGAADTAWSPLVTFEPPGGAPTLYLVPGAGLAAASYQPLARALRGRLSLAVLEPRGLDGRAPPCATLDEIVAVNLAAIEAADPHGPYRLAGHSFGGAVAFEMARLLVTQGKQVEIVLLDSVVHLPDAQRLERRSGAGLIVRLLADDGAPAGEGDASRALVERRLRELGLVPAHGGAALDGYFAVVDAQAAIYAAYRPSARHAGPVGLVLARQGGIASLPDEARARHYAECCEAAPRTSVVDGGHLSMLSAAHAGGVADALHGLLAGTAAMAAAG